MLSYSLSLSKRKKKSGLELVFKVSHPAKRMFNNYLMVVVAAVILEILNMVMLGQHIGPTA